MATELPSWSAPVTLAQPDGSPLSATGVETDPCVIKVGRVYHIWITVIEFDFTLSIYHGWSYTPSTFTMDTRLRLDLGAAYGAETISAVEHFGGLDGYFSRVEDQSIYDIFTTTTTTSAPRRWHRDYGPVFRRTLDWERPYGGFGGRLEPAVVKLPPSSPANLSDITKWVMAYSAFGVYEGIPNYHIGMAFSGNGGLFTQHPTPVLQAGSGWEDLWIGQPGMCVDSAGVAHLFYQGLNNAGYVPGAEAQPGKIGHAYGTDFINWTRDTNNPIVSPSYAAIGPCPLIDGNTLRLYYADTNASYVGRIKMVTHAI